jgi:hypothetical protein
MMSDQRPTQDPKPVPRPWRISLASEPVVGRLLAAPILWPGGLCARQPPSPWTRWEGRPNGS